MAADPPVSEGGLAAIIIEKAMEKLKRAVTPDVAIAGAGPAGLTAAWLLARRGLRVTIIEHRLGAGGGMRGGSMLLPVALVEEGVASKLLEEAGVTLEAAGKGLYVFDPSEAAVKLAAAAISSGAILLPGLHVEDLIVRSTVNPPRVEGLVVNLAPVVESGWHVDPLYIEARAVVDATGHEARLLRILEKRLQGKVRVPGMSSMDVWRAEKAVVEHAGEILPGLYVAGMSVAEAYNLPRMGPVFGGMLESAAKVAEMISSKLLNKNP